MLGTGWILTSLKPTPPHRPLFLIGGDGLFVEVVEEDVGEGVEDCRYRDRNGFNIGSGRGIGVGWEWEWV